MTCAPGVLSTTRVRNRKPPSETRLPHEFLMKTFGNEIEKPLAGTAKEESTECDNIRKLPLSLQEHGKQH